MMVDLIYSSPLWLASNAIRMSHDNHDKSDTAEIYNLEDGSYLGVEIGPKDKDLIYRIGNKYKHKSVLEQLVYTFSISDISRACLQELARHRTARLTVKSSRYTLKELKDEPSMYNTNQAEGCTWHWDLVQKYCVLTKNTQVNEAIAKALSNLQGLIEDGISNDIAKYALPDAFKTKLQWQIDGRNLQGFLELRSSKDALWEIRDLANAIFNVLPEGHKYLYQEFMHEVP